MSKKKTTTEQILNDMGLFETSPGVFSKVDPKHHTRGFEVDLDPVKKFAKDHIDYSIDLGGMKVPVDGKKLEKYPDMFNPRNDARPKDTYLHTGSNLPDVDLEPAIEPEVLPQGLIDFANNEGTVVIYDDPRKNPLLPNDKYVTGIDPYRPDGEIGKNFVFRKKGTYVKMNPEIEFAHSPEEIMDIYRQTGTMMVKPTPNRRTEPFPIPEIRLLTGKKRDIAVAELNEAAKTLIRDLGPVDIYIPTNVASSKNSKQLFKTGKKNQQVTRDAHGNTHTKVSETSFITDSQVSKAYRKSTEDSWKVNRLKFLAAVQGLKKPYSIELTFIRTTLGRMDLHNMAQLPFDLMVEYGWLADDESTEVIPVFNPVVYYSRHFAGLVIRVIR